MTKTATLGLIIFLVFALVRGTWTLVHHPENTPAAEEQTNILFDTQAVRSTHQSAPTWSAGKAELLE